LKKFGDWEGKGVEKREEGMKERRKRGWRRMGDEVRRREEGES
jgi:hypothetical protein